jgi:hypothetical protein
LHIFAKMTYINSNMQQPSQDVKGRSTLVVVLFFSFLCVDRVLVRWSVHFNMFFFDVVGSVKSSHKWGRVVVVTVFSLVFLLFLFV